MHGKRLLEDGTYRAGDNWQHGIDLESLAESFSRHAEEFKLLEQGFNVYHMVDDKGEHTIVSVEPILELSEHAVDMEDVLNAIRFNTEAYKLQLLGYKKE